MKEININQLTIGLNISLLMVGGYQGDRSALKGTIIGVCSHELLPDPAFTKAQHDRMYRRMDVETQSYYSRELYDGKYFVIKETVSGEVHYIHAGWIRPGSVLSGEHQWSLNISQEVTEVTRVRLENTLRENGIEPSLIVVSDALEPSYVLFPVYTLNIPTLREVIANFGIDSFTLSAISS